MIRSMIQIEGGEVQDFQQAFGFIYMDADERTAAPEKAAAVSSYAEEAGEHSDARVVEDAFDYTAKFLIEAPNKNLENVNAKIAAFNSAIRKVKSYSDVKVCKEIAFYNLYNRVKIVGIPSPITEPKEVYNSNIYGEMDFAEVELKIRVTNPKKCDFNLYEEDINTTPEDFINLSLVAHGLDIEARLSRPLNDDEHIVMLRKGSAFTNLNFRVERKGSQFSTMVKRKNKWQVYYKGGESGRPVYWPFYLDKDNIIKIGGDIHLMYKWDATDYRAKGIAIIRKSHGSPCYRQTKNGVTFGFAIYKVINGNNENHKRISNVCYFKSLLQPDGSTLIRT